MFKGTNFLRILKGYQNAECYADFKTVEKLQKAPENIYIYIYIYIILVHISFDLNL